MILEKLTLDDLSEMSQTCKRIHGLCVNQFQHRYKEKVFIIDGVSNDGTPIYGPYDKKYPAAFAKYTRNVIFGGKCANEATLQQLKTYYAKPEVASIKHLGFQNWYMNKSHSRFFVNMVKDVESVTFTNTYIDGDLNECVLKYMENMKELSLVNLYEERTTLTNRTNRMVAANISKAGTIFVAWEFFKLRNRRIHYIFHQQSNHRVFFVFGNSNLFDRSSAHTKHSSQ